MTEHTKSVLRQSSIERKKNPTEKEKAWRESLVGVGNPFFGKHHTDHTLQVLSDYASQRVGERNPFFGKHHKESTKQRIREKITPLVQGVNNPFYGRKHTATSKKLQSMQTSQFYKDHPDIMMQANLKKRGKPGHFRGKHHSEQTKKEMSLMKLGKPLSAPHVIKIFEHSGHKRFPYTSPNGVIIKMRSNWEVVYAHHLDSLNVQWEYEKHPISTKYGLYFPDFFLPNHNEFHEVKGYMSTLAKNKIEEAQQNHTIVIIDASIMKGILNEVNT